MPEQTASTYPYICTNGTKASGTSTSQNTEKCTSCNSGYALIDDVCTASDPTVITYPYVCTNGTVADGRSISQNTEKCTSCNSGYTLSDTVCAATPPSVTALAASMDGNGQITLTWTDSSASDLDHILVQYTNAGTENARKIFPSEETLVITGLDNATEYSFSVKAVSSSNVESDATTIAAAPGLCGDLSPTIVPETTTTINAGKEGIYQADSTALVTGGTGRHDNPWKIPLANNCKSLSYVVDYAGQELPIAGDTLTGFGFTISSSHHHHQVINVPSPITIDFTVTPISIDDAHQEVVFEGRVNQALVHRTFSTIGEPDSHITEMVAISDGILDLAYLNGPNSRTARKAGMGKVRYTIVIP